MLERISWTQYWIFIGIALACYYTWLVWKYFLGGKPGKEAKGAQLEFPFEEFKKKDRPPPAVIKAASPGSAPTAPRPMVNKPGAGLPFPVPVRLPAKAEIGKGMPALEEKPASAAKASDTHKDEIPEKDRAANAGENKASPGEPAVAAAASQDITSEETAEPSPMELQQLRMELMQKLTLDVEALAQRAAKKKMVQEEMVEAFRQLLKKEDYASLRDTAFEESISQTIASQVAIHCSIRLDAGVINGMWCR